VALVVLNTELHMVRILALLMEVKKKHEVGMVTNGMMLVPSFINICELDGHKNGYNNFTVLSILIN
jgi:hypothetical protein